MDTFSARDYDYRSSMNRLTEMQTALAKKWDGELRGRIRPHGDAGAHMEIGRKVDGGYIVLATVTIADPEAMVIVYMEPYAGTTAKELELILQMQVDFGGTV